MGIEVEYRRLKKAEWARLQKDPEKAASFLFESIPQFDMAKLTELVGKPEGRNLKPEDVLAALEKVQNDPRRVDLGKDWQALHFLLSGDPSESPEHLKDDPLHNVVMGGHNTNINSDYGPVRCLKPDEVKTIARELKKVSAEDLRGRFSAKAFNQQEIYPNPRPGGWNRRNVENVFRIYPRVVKFFQDAAAADEVVLIYGC
jgi:hypothetical protein